VLADSPAQLLAGLMLASGNTPQLLLVNGPSGAGKTLWCLALVEQARLQGLEVAGLVSPAVFADGIKTRIDLLDLRSGERRPLAVPRGSGQDGLVVGNWRFDPAAFLWGDDRLASIDSCQVLVLDELGPLEFERRTGLLRAFHLLAARRYQLACVGLRPSLLPAALQKWSWARVHTLPAGQVTP
jgi:nucleoside-triphosphatase THEP1